MSRAELTNFATLAIECALRRRCCARHIKATLCGKHNLREHLPSDKLTGNIACRMDRFFCFAIRVWCALHRSMCGINKLCNPAIRMRSLQEFGYVVEMNIVSISKLEARDEQSRGCGGVCTAAGDRGIF